MLLGLTSSSSGSQRPTINQPSIPRAYFLSSFRTSVKIFCLFLILGTQFLNSQIIKTEWIEWEIPQSILEKGISPRFITSNQFHDLYLLDDQNYWLVLIPGDGTQPRIAGGWGDSGELFSLPTDIIASPGLDVFVCDNATHRILRFDRKLNFIADIVLSTKTSNRIEYPYRIARNDLGEIIVASSEEWEINLISNDRLSITRMGDATYGEDRFFEIEDIGVGLNNEIGLIDLGTNTFIVLTRVGQVKDKIPLPDSSFGLVHWWLDRWIIVGRRGDIYVISPTQGIFKEILDQFPLKEEFFITDCTIIDDVIYIVDELSGKIYKAELRFLD